MEDTNFLIRDLSFAKAYYKSKANTALSSSIGDVELAKCDILRMLIEVIEKAIRKTLSNKGLEVSFIIKQTLVSDVSIEEIEPYNWPSDETLITHVWYQNKAVATVSGNAPEVSNPVVQNPNPSQKSWVDRNFKKIALATMVINLIKK